MILCNHDICNKKRIGNMNIAEQIRLKLNLKENSEVEYKSAAGGLSKTEFWRSKAKQEIERLILE